MLQKSLATKIISIVLIGFIAIVFYSCSQIIKFESLDIDSPYKIYGQAYGRFIDSTYTPDLNIWIQIDSTKFNKETIALNDSCSKKVILYISDDSTEQTELRRNTNVYTLYIAQFILDKHPDFNGFDDEYEIELVFTDQDSIINRYRYKAH